jgi:hypothetical protein
MKLGMLVAVAVAFPVFENHDTQRPVWIKSKSMEQDLADARLRF